MYQIFLVFLAFTFTFFTVEGKATAPKSTPYLIHNIYKGGFSVDGVDLFFDDTNHMEVQVGDPLYIQEKEIENQGEMDFYTHLFISGANGNHWYKSRIMTKRLHFYILQISENEECFKITLDDGSDYSISGDKSLIAGLQPGDVVTLGPMKSEFCIPYGEFPTAKIYSQGSSLIGTFNLIGLYKKPYSLAGQNTFRIVWTQLETYRTLMAEWRYPVIAFRDFYPRMKFCISEGNVDNETQLEFVERINDADFLFRKKNGDRVLLSFDIKGENVVKVWSLFF